MEVDPIIAKYRLQREQLEKDIKNTGAELMKIHANLAYWRGKRHRSKKAIKALRNKEQIRKMTLHKKLVIRKMTRMVRVSPRALGMA